MRQQEPVAGAVSAALSPMLATSAALIVLPQSRRPRSVRLTGWVSGRLIAMQNGGSACGYQAIFVPSTTLASPGHDGQPTVYLYIAALEVNILNCRVEVRRITMHLTVGAAAKR